MPALLKGDYSVKLFKDRNRYQPDTGIVICISETSQVGRNASGGEPGRYANQLCYDREAVLLCYRSRGGHHRLKEIGLHSFSSSLSFSSPAKVSLDIEEAEIGVEYS